MILIADDSRFMRNLLKHNLQKHGYNNFVEASNGREAILLYKLVKPSIALLDITMPEKDGLEALAEIKKIDPAAKIIMCSALATADNKAEAFRLGASDFIMKPFFEELHNKVRSLQLATATNNVESMQI